MSRKSIFLLAAAVVLIYFSIILFMLSPLHGPRNMYYGGAYMNQMFIRQVPTVNWCKELQFQSPPSENVVALVSYPGSGNTWLRYLLQQVTGIVTGSIYMDNGLRVHGFPAESVTDGSVLVVKTHQYPPEDKKFHSALLLIRNPRDAILFYPATRDVTSNITHISLAFSCTNTHEACANDFNRLHKGHIGTAPKSAFLKKMVDKKSGEDWPSHVTTQLSYWETLHDLWLTRFSGPVHIVFYETLVDHTQDTLQGILDFLNINVTEADMKCAMGYKEGIYRRRKKLQHFDPFTADMYKALDNSRSKVLRVVADYHLRHRRNDHTSLTRFHDKFQDDDYR